MRLRRTSLLVCPVELCAREVARPASLLWVAAPLLTFWPLDPPAFGPLWEPGPHRVRLLLGGRLPVGEHTLDIEEVPSGPTGTVFHDAGHSHLIKLWDHRIVLEDFHGMTRYTDSVDVRAGVLTPAVWLFAHIFYGHRQRRWHRLVTRGFDYS